MGFASSVGTIFGAVPLRGDLGSCGNQASLNRGVSMCILGAVLARFLLVSRS